MHESDLKLPTLPVQTAHPQQPSAPFSSVVKWSDLAALQTQLKMQNQVWYWLFLLKIKLLLTPIFFFFFFYFFQAIESLIQKFCEMEREKESQRCHIQTLQGKPLHCYWLKSASINEQMFPMFSPHR